MTTKELIQQVSAMTNKPQTEVKNTLTAMVSRMQSSLANQEEVKIEGLGKFSLKESAERMGFNPKTREAVNIAAKTSVKFSAASALKDMVQK